MTRILVPSGALGLDYDKAALARGVAMSPDLIAIDGGSTDSGPHYLGTGTSKYSRASTKIEWAGLMEAARQAGCPLVIGTAGTCGADKAVDWLAGITEEILTETGHTAKVALLKSGQPKTRVSTALAAGRIAPLEPVQPLDQDLIDHCTNIVALAGVEQINAALETGAEIVIAGRTTDTAIIAALPLAQGCHAGAAWHGAKIGECGAFCAATRPQSGVILLDFDAEGCTVRPLAEGATATPDTVMAHMLYENSDPFHLHEPGGHLDVTAARYTEDGSGGIRLTGACWTEMPYTVKLEGARRAGFQTVLIALIRDPHYIAHSEAWCADVLAKCRAKVDARLALAPDAYRIELRRVGADATLGPLENRSAVPVEIGVLGIITAPTEALAEEIGKMLNPYLLHHQLTQDEAVPTFAFPFSPAEMPRGAVHEFCLNHVMALDDPMEAFSLDVVNLG